MTENNARKCCKELGMFYEEVGEGAFELDLAENTTLNL